MSRLPFKLNQVLRPAWPPRRPPFWWPLPWPPRQPDRDKDLQPDDVRRRVALQVRAIREALGNEVAVFSATGRDEDAEFLYHPERILVRREDVDAVTDALKRGEQHIGDGRPDERDPEPIDGLVRYLIPPRASTGQVDVLATVDELEKALPREKRRDDEPGVATPDHLLHVMVGGHGNICPTNEPLPPDNPEPVPPLEPDKNVGAGIRVSVIDTGWWPPAKDHHLTPWFDQLDDQQSDQEVIADYDKFQVIPLYAGHGTFVAGVVACVAPGAAIEVEGFLTHGGGVWESEIVRQLNEAMTDVDDPRIISISAGGRTRGDMAMLSFQILSTLSSFARKRNAPLVVAAAGNDGADMKLWPAAFDWVLSVGALDADGKVAGYSNYGSWVDVFARGTDLVNAFPKGTYTTTYENPGEVRTFDGVARWSGTSFATPLVAGRIAAHMSTHGVDARAARDALLQASSSVTAPNGATSKSI